MAYWIEDSKPFNDPTRDGSETIISYGCDTTADVANLPTDQKTLGSSCFVLSPVELYKLGSAGWVKVG